MSSVTLQRALDLFTLCNGNSCAPLTGPSGCIPFLYPDNGCWARAHEMCRLLIAAGETPKKQWASGRLRVKTPNHPACYEEWNWHVAPTLQVDAGTGPETYVLDPALFDRPVPLATWKGALGDPKPTLKSSGADVFNYYLDTTDRKYAETQALLEWYRMELKLRAADPAYGPPPYNCPAPA